jgi:hypothetical protein
MTPDPTPGDAGRGLLACSAINQLAAVRCVFRGRNGPPIHLAWQRRVGISEQSLGSSTRSGQIERQ